MTKEPSLINVLDLPFSSRIRNALINANLKTVSDILKLSIEDVKKFRNIGKTSVKEIARILSDLGFSWNAAAAFRQNERHFYRWIDMQERIPPQDVFVLIVLVHYHKKSDYVFTHVNIAKRMNGNWYFCDKDENQIDAVEYRITHWMPMPDIPELMNKI